MTNKTRELVIKNPGRSWNRKRVCELWRMITTDQNLHLHFLFQTTGSDLWSHHSPHISVHTPSSYHSPADSRTSAAFPHLPSPEQRVRRCRPKRNWSVLKPKQEGFVRRSVHPAAACGKEKCLLRQSEQQLVAAHRENWWNCPLMNFTVVLTQTADLVKTVC